MTRLLALLLLAASLHAAASPLDEAVALVLAAHPVLSAARGEVLASDRQHDWKSDLTLSWTEQGTDYGGPGGTNAAIRVSIPLFDRSSELRRAKATTAATRTESEVIGGFLAEVEKLRASAGKVRELDTLRALQRDRLEYKRKQVDEGLAEADMLWPEAERMQKAEHDYRRELEALDAALEITARKYGGDEWKRLRDLLDASTKPDRR